MAFKRTLAQRLLNISKKSNTVLSNCRISSSSQSLISRNQDKVAPDPGDEGVFRRFLQWRPIYQSAAPPPELRLLPRGGKLLEKLRGMDIAKDRIRLDGLIPPPVPEKLAVREAEKEENLSVEDARKLLRVSQLEIVKSKLRHISKEQISLEEFVEICSENCSNAEQGKEFAKRLDESGTVIVLGDVVFLRPQQILKVIQHLVPAPIAHPDKRTLKELEEMEKEKAAIDKRAESLVRRELWCGLSYLVIQTAAFMRLTFWELSWDVMEPICFYITSMYFMAGYAFFLRTSKEPSFEGFFQSRFSTKQKQLMKMGDFDVGRYSELRTACGHDSSLHPSFDSSTKRSGDLH